MMPDRHPDVGGMRPERTPPDVDDAGGSGIKPRRDPAPFAL